MNLQLNSQSAVRDPWTGAGSPGWRENISRSRAEHAMLTAACEDVGLHYHLVTAQQNSEWIQCYELRRSVLVDTFQLFNAELKLKNWY